MVQKSPSIKTSETIDENISNLKLFEQLKTLAEENQRMADSYSVYLQEVKELEDKYCKEREIYLMALEVARIGIYDTGVQDTEFWVKENWLVRLGYKLDEVKAKNIVWEDLIHPDDRDRVLSIFGLAQRGEVDTLVMEYRLKDAQGNYRWIQENSKVIERLDDGTPRIVGTHYDITKIREIEIAEREYRIFADALSATTAIFDSTLDIYEVLDMILAETNEVSPSDGSDIWLLDSSCTKVSAFAQGASEKKYSSIFTTKIDISELPLFSEILASRKPIYLPDVKPGTYPVPTRNPKMRSMLCVPINFNDYQLGFLVVNSSTPNNFSERQRIRIQAFANQAAIALRNAQLFQQTREVAALEERQRLAREMHDALSQTIFSASLRAEVLSRIISQTTREDIQTRTNELHRLLRGALGELRTLLMELRPETLVHTELPELLRQLSQGLEGRIDAKIVISTEGESLLPPDVQVVFFRVAQESLNNVIKHSRATEIKIDYRNRRNVVMTIEDNGCGYEGQILEGKHMGTAIMLERAKSIGAKLIIKSKPGCGTLVKLTWRKTNVQPD